MMVKPLLYIGHGAEVEEGFGLDPSDETQSLRHKVKV